MEIKRTCPICGDPIIGRIDKKFCTDQCRNEFNNRNNKDTINTMRRINGILRKNRRILAELNPEGKAMIPRYRLLDKGFDFRYITSIYRSRTGNTYYYCYEQGYLALSRELFALVIRR